MKTIIRNFISLLRRFKVATILNILGLTVAFAAFILIMIQVKYDLNFNRNIPNAGNIYRLELRMQDQWVAITPRPFADLFINSSPHVVDGSYHFAMAPEIVVGVDKGNVREMFWQNLYLVLPNHMNVFSFNMVEGDAGSIEAPGTLLIPESMARKVFGDEPAVGKLFYLEESFLVEQETWTIGGVYKDFPDNSSVKNYLYASVQDNHKEIWGDWSYCTFIVLDDPANMERVMANYMENHHEEMNQKLTLAQSALKVRLVPFTDLHFTQGVLYDLVDKSSRQTIYVLIDISIILLFIAAINYTNFSMALTPIRIKSINTQKVLGAGQAMLRWGLLFETVTICLLSFFLALFLVHLFSVSSLHNLVSAEVSLSDHAFLIVATAGISLIVALCAGLYPSFYITSFSPALVLKGSFGMSPKGKQLRNTLVAFQYISSFVLIICAAFIYLQNRYMVNNNLGYDKGQVLVSTINDNVRTGKNVLQNELLAYSGIESVSFVQDLMAAGEMYSLYGRDFRQDQDIQYYNLCVDPAFFDVMGIQVTEGRPFRMEDAQHDGALVFNKMAKDAYNLELGEKIGDEEIIGFMQDIPFTSYRMEMAPMAFQVTKDDWFTPGFVLIKTRPGVDLQQTMDYFRNTLTNIDNAYPFKMWFYDEVVQQMYEKENILMKLIGLFSLIAIFISIVGVFGLVIFESEYKLKEIGVRKVLGSTTGAILLDYNKNYLLIVSGCFVVAAPLAWYGVSRWLENFVYKVPIYLWVFALAFLFVSLITIATVTYQNWRAANTNPVNTLKSE